MELAHLKYLTRRSLATARVHLLKNGNVQPFSEFIHADGGIEHANVSGEWFGGNDAKKDVLFWTMGEHCKRVGAQALIMVTDSWTLEQTREQQKRILTDPVYCAEFEKASRFGMVAAAAAGFGRLTETLHCQGQTVDLLYGLSQDYERVAADGVIPATSVAGPSAIPDHKIRLRGQPIVRTVDNNPGVDVGGRMFVLYKNGANSEIDPEHMGMVKAMIEKIRAENLRRKGCQNQNQDPTQR